MVEKVTKMHQNWSQTIQMTKKIWGGMPPDPPKRLCAYVHSPGLRPPSYVTSPLLPPIEHISKWSPGYRTFCFFKLFPMVGKGLRCKTCTYTYTTFDHQTCRKVLPLKGTRCPAKYLQHTRDSFRLWSSTNNTAQSQTQAMMIPGLAFTLTPVIYFHAVKTPADRILKGE